MSDSAQNNKHPDFDKDLEPVSSDTKLELLSVMLTRRQSESTGVFVGGCELDGTDYWIVIWPDDEIVHNKGTVGTIVATEKGGKDSIVDTTFYVEVVPDGINVRKYIDTHQGRLFDDDLAAENLETLTRESEGIDEMTQDEIRSMVGDIARDVIERIDIETKEADEFGMSIVSEGEASRLIKAVGLAK